MAFFQTPPAGIFLRCIGGAVSACGLVACATMMGHAPGSPCSAGVPDPQAQAVDIDTLASAPEAYAGRLVRLRAFLVNEFEGQGLYRSAGEHRRAPLAHRLSRCKAPEPFEPSLALWWKTDRIVVTCNRRQVWIEGVFDPCERGHMGGFAGGLHEVTFVGSAGP